ncbi:class I SAM-dependent methyltransferase [Pacificimonas sp. ICDLI1SI03]
MTGSASASQRDDVIADIESLADFTVEERGRQRFASALRRYAIQDLAEAVDHDYHDRIAPALDQRTERPNDARGIEAVMASQPTYRLYSSLRYNAQEMCFQSVQDGVERVLPRMTALARQAADANPGGGSLRLDPSLEMPRYLDALDVHLTPGCFHTEWGEEDVAQGAVVSLGSRVFTASMAFRSWGGVARVISRWLKHERPDFAPARMLDIGTSSGKNLIPYLEAFPGVEAHGIDVAAPLLRYGHAIASHLGAPVNFAQMNAEAMDFPDQSFDLIVSSFFFHEIPVKSTRRVLAECRRLLKPGGIMVHQELPATGLVGPWEDFFWNWDTEHNNEPFYTAFRAQDPIALCEEAGFDRDDCFATILPDPGAFPDRTAAFDWDEPGRPRHGKGGWYVFGSKG